MRRKASPFIVVFAAGAALAQDKPPSGAGDQPIEEVVVTGSRIRQDAQSFANPVTSFSADTIAKSGRTEIADFLSQSPALIGSTTGDLTAGSNPGFGEVGLNLLDLRHLGVDRTLVLVDGRRHVSGLAGSAAVDVDSIPTDLIEAVDVLTGGASAVYGADGVSGVVNFRLKKNFEGLMVRGQESRSSRGDGEQRVLALTAGTNFSDGRGNFALAYEFHKDERVFDQQRSYLRPLKRYSLAQNQDDLDDDPNVPDNIPYNDIRYADSSPTGAVDVDGDYAPDFEGNGHIYDRGFLLENSGGFSQGGSSTQVDGYQGDLFPASDRHIVNLLGHFDVSDSLTLSAEAKYARTRAFSVAQPSYDFYLLETADNPFMPQVIRDAIVPGAAAEFFGDPDTPDGAIVTRDNFDLGTNGEDTTRETMRGVLAANGTINDHLRYEASYTYGETRSRIVEVNNRIADRWLAAIDVVADPMSGQPVCRSSLDPDADPALAGCVPYNIFGFGVRDQAAADWVNVDSVSHSKVTQSVVSGSISGDFGNLLKLPGGSIGYAIGAEYRRETSDSVPAQEIQDGLTWVGPISPSSGSFDVKELFAEVNLPVLTNERFANKLSFGGAFRASDYSTIGKTSSWKVDAVYAPVQAVTFRGTYAQAVRAPNIQELFSPQTSSFNFIVDPCDINQTNNGSSTRVANCAALLDALGVDPSTFVPSNDPSSTLFTQGTFSGNRNLQEETAKTWTAGIVLRPEFIRNFTLSFDWYDIRIEGAINTPEAQELAQLCVDAPTLDNPYCANIERDPDSGFIVGFNAEPANVAARNTAGMDMTLDWGATTDLGDFRVQVVGGYLAKLEFFSVPGAEVNDNLGQQYFPKFSGTLDTTWTHGPLTLAYGINWFGKTDRFTRETLRGDPDYSDPRYFKVKEKWDHEISASYDFGDHVNVYAGVNNLFDQKPAFDYPSYPISAMGRFFYAGAKMNFGGK
jgi:iron complex outermembrane receptor protein